MSPHAEFEPSAGQVVRRCGRFTLTQSEQGYWWALAGRAGGQWYWDPAAAQFTGSCRFSPTPASATAGLERTLAREEAGELYRQETRPAR